MPLHIDPSSRLVYDADQSIALTCPHCQVLSHVTPTAVPRFDDLQARRPKIIGLVFRCDACLAPVFLRFAVRIYGAHRIELSPQYTEVERAKEKFSFTYLPSEVELLFKEALLCFSAGAHNAFASMCRRTAQAIFADLGEAGRLRIFDELNEVRQLADIESEVFLKVKAVLFGTDAEPRQPIPLLDAVEAGILVEVMKDLLYEAYVRKGKLHQAMMVRRFLSDETAAHVTPISQAGA